MQSETQLKIPAEMHHTGNIKPEACTVSPLSTFYFTYVYYMYYHVLTTFFIFQLIIATKKHQCAQTKGTISTSVVFIHTTI